MNVPILSTEKRWECPSCGRQVITHEPRPHSELHACPAQHGLVVPFVEVQGTGLARNTVRHVPVEREDYIGSEKGVRFDDEGRPVMAVRTERADGSNDCHVFATAATATTREAN